MIHDSTTCTAGANGRKCEMCHFAREFEKSRAKSPSDAPLPENWQAESLAPELENASQVKYGSGIAISETRPCDDCHGSGQGAGLHGVCPYCHGDGKVETYATRRQRVSNMIVSAPDFEREWSSAPASHTRYTEKAEAEHWFQRGLWLGIQYERERGLVALNQDLREMQRIARERMG